MEKILYADPNPDWTRRPLLVSLRPTDFAFKYIQAADREALAREIQDTSYLITGWQAGRIDDALLRQATSLRLVQMLGAGFETVDVAAAENHGIWVANTAGINAVAVAEHVIMFLLSFLRRLPRADAALKEGDWPYQELQAGGLEELEGKTVGIIGMGNIGRELSRRISSFNVKILYYDQRRVADIEDQTGAAFVSLKVLLKEADAITLHVPLTPKTRGMIGWKEIDLMKPSALMINTARGALIDQKALVAALTSGKIGGACLDCFLDEPLKPDDPLRGLKNVILTPHIAGATKPVFERALRIAFNNVRMVAANGCPSHAVNAPKMKNIN